MAEPVYVECDHCKMDIICHRDGDIELHMSECNERPLTYGEFKEVANQVAEIHAFAKQLAETLDAISKNPMALMGMLPR